MRALAAALALVLVAAAPAAAQPGVTPEHSGQELFEGSCATCHGADARGIEGRGPSLVGVGGWRADFYLRTGRMPLDAPDDQPRRTEPGFDPREIDALAAYVERLGEPVPVPHADPSKGSISEGQYLFTLKCAGCHQVVAQGGITTGARIPDLQRSTPDDVAQAVRMGPFLMPPFSEEQITQEQLDSIARYVEWTHDPVDAGGWGIGHLGPIPEGMVTWFLAMGLLLVVIRVLGERSAR